MRSCYQCENVCYLLLLLLQPLLDGATAAFGGLSAGTVAHKVAEFRVRSQNLHVDDIERQLNELEHQVDSLDVPRFEEEFNRVEARVRTIEKTNCEENEFVCGGDKHQCVHHLLVCDGTTDCYNGRDEDKKLCSGDQLHVGSTFGGEAFSHLGFRVSNMHVIVTVIQKRRSPFFTSHTYLRVRFETEYMDERLAFEFDATYVHATRKLQIVRGKPTEAPYVINCEFHYADDDRLYCTGHLEASMFKAVSYVLVRV